MGRSGTLILIAGPPLGGRGDLSRSLSQRRAARLWRLTGEELPERAEVAAELREGRDVVLEGDLTSESSRARALALAGDSSTVLVSWSATRDDAERQVRNRFAGRPEYVDAHEIAAYERDDEVREGLGAATGERVAIVAAGLTLDEQIAAVECLLPQREPVLQADLETHAARRRVLVVDDDPEMRESLLAVLDELGFAALACASGEEALARLERRSFDLVVADQRMPGMSGIELLDAVSQRFPSVRTLLLTGYGDDPTCAAALSHGAATVLAKPLRVIDLQRALDEALH